MILRPRDGIEIEIIDDGPTKYWYQVYLDTYSLIDSGTASTRLGLWVKVLFVTARYRLGWGKA